MFKRLLRSFATGFVGIGHVVRSERNMRIHVVAALGVIGAGSYFGLAGWEWVAVLLCIGLVLAAECVNTAIERLADRLSMEWDPLIKQAKDSSAAAVLLLSLISAVVGGLIFLPRFRALTEM